MKTGPNSARIPVGRALTWRNEHMQSNTLPGDHSAWVFSERPLPRGPDREYCTLISTFDAFLTFGEAHQG